MTLSRPIDQSHIKRNLKALGFLLAAILATSAHSAEKPDRVTWGGKAIEDITDVHLNPDGKIIVIYSGGGFSTTEDQLPAEFLRAWGLTEEKLKDAKSARTQTAQGALERAIRSGQFREVDGIVYDLRKVQAEWVQFPKAKVLQVIDRGAILDSTPDQPRPTAIFVRHLPVTISDTDTVSFTAKLTGSFTYINKLGDDRTIRAYDLGRACTADEIPEAILKQNKLWAKMVVDGNATRDVLSKLPDNEAIKGNGSGFFITTNGFLLTNWHVVRDARKVKIRTNRGVFGAEIITADRTKDLALLRVEGASFKALPISNDGSVSLGDDAFTIGFPNVEVQGLEPKYTDGKISSLTGLHDDPAQYQISVPVQPGNSGGPLINASGRVIGIIDAKLNDIGFLVRSGSLPQNVNYAIKANVIREFLQTNPEVSLPVSNEVLKMDDAVKAAQEAIAMVLVY